MTDHPITESFVTEQLRSIRGQLPDWIEEAAALVELAANGERTGVPPDPRTVERAKRLLAQLTDSADLLSRCEMQPPTKRLLSETRIIKATIAAAQNEAREAGESFRLNA
jgi:hypothetical protein